MAEKLNEQEILEELDLGAGSAEHREREKPLDLEGRNSAPREDVTNPHVHFGSQKQGETLSDPGVEAGNTDTDAPSPFGTPSGGILTLDGPRDDFFAKNLENGAFEILHLPTGESVKVTGLDYLNEGPP